MMYSIYIQTANHVKAAIAGDVRNGKREIVKQTNKQTNKQTYEKERRVEGRHGQKTKGRIKRFAIIL